MKLFLVLALAKFLHHDSRARARTHEDLLDPGAARRAFRST